MGARGRVVKQCKKGREKDSKQKKKPDIVAKRNERQREKQYYKEYREKKRGDDEEAYLKHNAEVQKNWRENNQERVSQWRTNNVNYRLKGIKQQAGIKGLHWCDTMTKEVCTAMMTSPCFYCDLLSTETVNGIDRMDNCSHYTVSNCVPCCKLCNFTKIALDANTFVQRCAHISVCHGGEGEMNHTIWKDSKCSTYKAYTTRAERKELSFELTRETFDNIRDDVCLYCKKENTKTHSNGIDRSDNTLGYTSENSVACCGECNYMKGALHQSEFVKLCKKICVATRNKSIPEMPQRLSCI